MFPYSDQFFGEYPHLLRRLFCLRRVPLPTLVGLRDVGSGFGFKGFQTREIAIEFAAVGAY